MRLALFNGRRKRIGVIEISDAACVGTLELRRMLLEGDFFWEPEVPDVFAGAGPASVEPAVVLAAGGATSSPDDAKADARRAGASAPRHKLLGKKAAKR